MLLYDLTMVHFWGYSSHRQIIDQNCDGDTTITHRFHKWNERTP
ncbi:hypothetical protein M565_ctg5P0788 [Vibrio cyclitrophicus FF75]|nr:hypothetical protein M565_ctg5P0788 [Vibrio cyclitrophicus FF75]